MASAQSINVLLRLLNGRRFRSELVGSGAAVKGFAKEVEAAGAASSGLAYAGHAASSSLYAIGSASRVAGLGVGAIAAVATTMGLKFDATMESNTLAFEKFTGSAAASRDMLNQLFEVAAATPFTFGDITTAARRLMAFGFNAQETTKWIKILGDTISYTGGSADEVFRAVKAIGEIKGIGRLQQRQILQLTNLGVNAHDILTKNLHLTEKQLHNIGRAGIDANKALAALETGFTQEYGGGAAKYSKTFIGQIEKTKDYMQRAAGQLVQPLFDTLKKRTFPSINDWLSGGKGAHAKGGKQQAGGFVELIPKIQGVAKVVGGVLVGAFQVGKAAVTDLLNALKPAEPFLQNVLIPLFKGLLAGVVVGVIGAFQGLILIIRILAPILGFLGKILRPVKFIFEGIGFVIGFIATGPILKFIGALGKFGGIFKLIGGAAKLLLIPFKAFDFLIGGMIRGGAGFLRFMESLGGKFKALVTPIIDVIKWYQAFVRMLIGKYLSAVVAVANRLGSLGTKFYEAGVGLAKMFIKGIAGIGKAILRAFVGGAAFVMNVGSALRKWINDHTLFGNKIHIPIVGDIRIPALAGGGYIAQSGIALVGERGPELVSLPSGSHVISNRAAKASLRGNRATGLGHATGIEPAFEGVNVLLQAPIIIDKREVGMAVGQYTADRRARS